MGSLIFSFWLCIALSLISSKVGGWSSPAPHPQWWTSALFKLACFHWIWAELVWECKCRNAASSLRSLETHPSNFPAYVLSHFPYRSHILGHSLSSLVFSFFLSFSEAVVIEVRGILNFLPGTVLYFSTLWVLWILRTWWNQHKQGSGSCYSASLQDILNIQIIYSQDQRMEASGSCLSGWPSLPLGSPCILRRLLDGLLTVSFLNDGKERVQILIRFLVRFWKNFNSRDLSLWCVFINCV